LLFREVSYETTHKLELHTDSFCLGRLLPDTRLQIGKLDFLRGEK
jgi:hypothetical protein